MPELFQQSDDKRYMLTAEDFEKLVSGGIIRIEGVAIALKDIGYDLMLEIINKLKQEL